MNLANQSRELVFSVDSLKQDEEEAVREVLNELGLNDSENLLLFTLLRRGSRQVSSLSKLTGINRAYIYGILDRLNQRGLISVHEKRGVRHFSALPLDSLLAKLDQKQAVLARQRERLSELIDTSSHPSVELWSDPQTRSDRGAETRARIFQELTRIRQSPSFLFCNAVKSSLFENSNPSPAAIVHLLHLSPPGLFIMLYSENGAGELIAAETKNQAIAGVKGKLPTEMLVTDNQVTLIGRNKQSDCSITFEQPALAANLAQMASTLFGFGRQMVVPPAQRGLKTDG